MIFHFFGEIGERPVQLRKIKPSVRGKHRRFQRHRAAVISRHLGKKRFKIDDSVSRMQNRARHAPHTRYGFTGIIADMQMADAGFPDLAFKESTALIHIRRMARIERKAGLRKCP